MRLKCLHENVGHLASCLFDVKVELGNNVPNVPVVVLRGGSLDDLEVVGEVLTKHEKEAWGSGFDVEFEVYISRPVDSGDPFAKVSDEYGVVSGVAIEFYENGGSGHAEWWDSVGVPGSILTRDDVRTMIQFMWGILVMILSF